MGETTQISWADGTFNPWIGCTKVSEACKNCYAEVSTPARKARSNGLELWGADSGRQVTGADYWKQPARWNRKALEAGERRRIFCASLADVFEDRRDLDAHRARLFALIEATPALDWLLLTKRPDRVLDLVPSSWRAAFPQNVWQGTTVENQRRAAERVPHLLKIPAAVLFLSIEPMSSAVDLSSWLTPATLSLDDAPIDWVICGGESGTDARPMHPDWVRSIRDQCVAAGVPFFFKQWGEYQYDPRMFTNFSTWVNKAQPWIGGTGAACVDTAGNVLRCGSDFAEARTDGLFPVAIAYRVGKKAAGAGQDGRRVQELPP